MREPVAIAVAQPECTPLDVAANAIAHAEAVRRAGARVVVFPEMSLTGYELDAPSITADDPRLAPLIEACAETGSLALAGAPVEEHIAMLAIDGNGANVVYRKMFVHSSESRFAPGSKPAVIEVDGWRLGLAICRDTRFPEHAAAMEMDVYVAGVLGSPQDAPVHDERARRVATDHRVWVAVASFAGSTGGGFDQAAGLSNIWSPEGVVIAQAGPEVGAIARAVLSDGPLT